MTKLKLLLASLLLFVGCSFAATPHTQFSQRGCDVYAAVGASTAAGTSHDELVKALKEMGADESALAVFDKAIAFGKDSKLTPDQVFTILQQACYKVKGDTSKLDGEKA